MRGIRPKRVGLIAGLAALVCTGAAYASIVGLPPGAQVNNDPPSIDPTQNAGLVDLTAGSLVAGKPRVPWATFSQMSGSSQQIFVRAFKGGSWQTEGFPESLNEDTTQAAQAPSIDFTGANRTVPWVAWGETSTVPTFSGARQIFASRFASQPAPAQNGGQWVHEGQEVPGTAPSLNINTNRDADVPALIGGAAVAGNNPVPWVTWQEADNGNTVAPAGSPSLNKVATNSTFQIFVSRAVAATGGNCPAGTKPAHGTISVGNFCFQQVGVERVKDPSSAVTDPSLNVDPTRDGIQADIAFTGKNDAVPWVVWYENSDNGIATDGLLNADMVFAARGIPDTTAGVDGGFHWQVVGLGTAGKTSSQDILNTSGANQAGDCATGQASELACSLDADQTLGDASKLTDGNGAENPQVTAGTMVPGKATTPWVAWDESNTNNGLHSVFVARLDPAGDHFDLLNNGQPISHSGLDSTRPDIVFSHNIPYVSWHETNGTTTETFVGHFEGNPANPTFHIDTPAAGIPTTNVVTSDDDATDVRTAMASTCPADPFTLDGAACQGGSIGTPFFAFTNGSPRALFAQAYQPDNVQTGAGSGSLRGQATLTGSVNPAGAPVNVEFDYGPTKNYGHVTPPQLLLGSPTLESQTGFSATIANLAPGTYHFRAVVLSDFGTFNGRDNTVTIPNVSSHPTSPHGRVKARNLRSIKGTATATFGVRRVQVAVVEYAGGARVARAKRPKPSCEQLGRDGKLHKLNVGKHQICTPTTFLTASGTTKWTLKLSRRLPKGNYVAISRATDRHGNVEILSTRDQISFQVI